MEKNVNSNAGIGGASNSVPQTRRVFSSRKYGFRVVKYKNGFYLLKGKKFFKGIKTRDFQRIFADVKVIFSPKVAYRMKEAFGE
jgi:hypothetical protein